MDPAYKTRGLIDTENQRMTKASNRTLWTLAVMIGAIAAGAVAYRLRAPLLMIAANHNLLPEEFACSLAWETEFAPGYSESAFRQLEIGSRANRVVQLLGQPWSIYTPEKKGDRPPIEIWQYARSPRHSSFIARNVWIDLGTHMVYTKTTGVNWD